MAIGADQLFADVIVRMKNTPHTLYPNMELMAAIPFRGQELSWPKQSQDRYRDLLTLVTHTKIVSEGGYSPAKMQIRNAWMVDNSAVVLAIWDGTKKGGTWNCIQYALKKKKFVIHLHSQNLTFTELGL
jgi:uncharacterized phage-like protein YoqJ